ncbi:MAG: YigZ family protein [Bacteroidales bacterium]|nr:YigZ family protein [Bacteroidales bacterium]
MTDTYKTITKLTKGSFKDRGSKFFAFAYPVENEEEVNTLRAEVRKKYHDARHHVYAFQIGIDEPIFRASDDGEPSNSSGPPVLGQIRSFGLTNILIIVIRYFGGTKLGIPGLINAYKSAAADALNKAKIIEKNIEINLKIMFQYAEMNEVMRITKIDGVRIINQKLEMDCTMNLGIKKSLFTQIYESFKSNRNIIIDE